MSSVSATTGTPASVLQTVGVPAPRDQRAEAIAPREAVPAPKHVVRAEVNLEETTRPAREAVEQAATRIEAFVRSVGRSLDFSVDTSTGRSILRVVNPENGEVIRQLPPEETLRVARAVEYMQSVLVSQRA